MWCNELLFLEFPYKFCSYSYICLFFQAIKKLLEDYFKEEGIANIEAKKKTQIPQG